MRRKGKGSPTYKRSEKEFTERDVYDSDFTATLPLHSLCQNAMVMTLMAMVKMMMMAMVKMMMMVMKESWWPSRLRLGKWRDVSEGGISHKNNGPSALL